MPIIIMHFNWLFASRSKLLGRCVRKVNVEERFALNICRCVSQCLLCRTLWVDGLGSDSTSLHPSDLAPRLL